MRPAGFLRHPGDVGGEVFVFVLGVGTGVSALAADKLGVMFVEGLADLFKEGESEGDVLVFRRIHVVAELQSLAEDLSVFDSAAIDLLGVAFGVRRGAKAPRFRFELINNLRAGSRFHGVCISVSPHLPQVNGRDKSLHAQNFNR